MTDVEQKNAVRQFVKTWTGRGDEKQDTQTFWRTFLRDVFGVEKPEDHIKFEVPVKLDHTSFIDALMEDTRVLIEQKSLGIDLRKGSRQSDGAMLNAFQQGKRYSNELAFDKKPRWIVACNFSEFHIHDMNRPHDEPEVILLSELEKEYHRMSFLVDKTSERIKREEAVSVEAGKLVGKLYDALIKQYNKPKDKTEELRNLHSLNTLCVRLVFCLYAEDAGIFGGRNMFHDFLKKKADQDIGSVRRALKDLFLVLDQKPEDRDPYEMDAELMAFPYVNGGLFKNEIIIPRFTQEIVDLLLSKASENFNWSEISPTIFGASFESTLNPETRRAGGMHYTSVADIHKVIDPLFLDDLTAELDSIEALSVKRTRERKLTEFQKKLASLTFLDPACGSGNFLTETYLSLRRLENRAVKLFLGDDIIMGDASDFDPIRVSISQFHGIEINDFAVTVAKTALWIAESQMMQETKDIVYTTKEFLPLTSQANIVEANALRYDWEDVVPRDKLNYIMGNPPFVGARMMDQGSEQKKDVQTIFGNIKDVQDLDYVTCWYKLAAKMMYGTKIETAFVSTNSVSQGAQVPILWNVLLNQHKLSINFAHQTFKWNNDSINKAAVHCVIIGFSAVPRAKKMLFSNGVAKEVANISPYLVEGGNVYVTAQKNALCDVPRMNFGNQPRDGGHFVIDAEERADILHREPALEKWLHPYIGAEEFIKGKERWCLWLKNASPMEIMNSKILRNKVEAVRQMRLESKAKTTQGYAKVPHLFAQITQPDDLDYMIVPSVSSEKRRYVPIGFMKADTIASNAVQIVPGSTLYHFGILTSNVHMAWMRTVCGRLEMRYRYSKELVYNTFPWPQPTDAQKAKIEQTAQAILDVRAKYANCNLASLYDDATMPADLRTAHQKNDRAVWEAYGKRWAISSANECVAELMKMYQELTAK